jgi:4-oxalocrotonate tautomerase|tara:strand:- start:257 stop:457 length:201 start_codon:yes stop_codon:yes gene_type:complete
MPVVKIDLWAGRTEELKENLIKKVTDVVVAVCKCPKEAVTIVINDIPKENWGSGGEQHSKKFKNIP